MQRTQSHPVPWLATFALASVALPLRAQPDPSTEAVRILEEHLLVAGEVAASEAARISLGNERLSRLEAVFAEAEAALEGGDALAGLRPYTRIADALAQVLVTFDSEPIESFEQLTNEAAVLRAELDELGSPLEGRSGRPVALQALLEGSHTAAHGYLVSAGEQGRETSLIAGIHYLKVARSKAELARMLASLDCESPERPVGDVAGLTAYLDRLEAELLELYQPPLTQDRHSTFIQLSAGLKLAREMRDQGHQLGALEEGLDVARGIALFDEEGRPQDPAELGSLIEHWQGELDAAETDVSFPTLLLADARSDMESDPVQSAIVLRRMLPDYFGCFEADAPDSDRGEAQVTVTLVRWPFT